MEVKSSTDDVEVLRLVEVVKRFKFYPLPDLKRGATMSKTITPSEQFFNRVRKAFGMKKLIGDISVSDEEFDFLVEYFIGEFNKLRYDRPSVYDDPLLCVAMVQIGIRYYNGNYWSHVKKILKDFGYNDNHQTLLGDAFVSTMKKHEKLLLSDNERVNNILMHGFVCDNYADKFFSFLFAFYDRDLERDILRLNKITMDGLIEIIKRKDNTGRTYFLVEQTADAVRKNTRGGKPRIRRYINLIDHVFWGETLTFINPNRLTSRFLTWTKSSDDFILTSCKYNNGITIRKGKKSYSSPYLKWSQTENSFSIILPPQIINYSININDGLFWEIKVNGCQKQFREMQLYQAVTGYKSENDEIAFLEEDLFFEITATIIDASNKTIQTFRIKQEVIRFFDGDGDFLSFESIGKGQAYSFTNVDFIPISEAVEDVQHYHGLILTCYNFEIGDIIRLPDGKPLSIGKKFEDGLLPRGIISGADADCDGERCPIYSSPPSLILILRSGRENGTAVIVNGNLYNLFDTETQTFTIDDRSGNIGYKISFKDFINGENKIFEVLIDVPNDRQTRFYRFAMIHDFSYEFEGAPYIFRSRGTITFPSQIVVTTTAISVEKCVDDNSFNFDITAESTTLPFFVNTIPISILVPALFFRFDGEEWQTDRHTNVWYSDFIAKLYLAYPSDIIRFCLDDSDDLGERGYKKEEVFRKIKSRDVFECDLNRFKSWFGRVKFYRTIFLEIRGLSDHIDFLRVDTKSCLNSSMIKGDFEKEVLYGDFDIEGRSEYSVDVFYADQLISEKLKLEKGRFEIKSELKSGVYSVILYENENDESGFGDNSIYFEMTRVSLKLINPKNLIGETVVITGITDIERPTASINLSCSYYIELVAQINTNIYLGEMSVKTNNDNNLILFPVNVEFFNLDDLKQIYITFIEDGEKMEFLYDEERRIIVKEEDNSLDKKAAYRRYKRSLYPEDYIYKVALV